MKKTGGQKSRDTLPLINTDRSEGHKRLLFKVKINFERVGSALLICCNAMLNLCQCLDDFADTTCRCYRRLCGHMSTYP